MITRFKYPYLRFFVEVFVSASGIWKNIIYLKALIREILLVALRACVIFGYNFS